MNWLIVGLVLLLFYVIWFFILLRKRKYNKALLFLALAQFPYLLVNLVAPFRGIFDSQYAGYSMGMVNLPQGFLVPLVVGSIVLACFFIASRALANKMARLWVFSFVLNTLLLIFAAIPIAMDVFADLNGFRLELGEYLQVSGIWVALIMLIIFVFPTLFASLYSGRMIYQNHLQKREKAAAESQ